MKTVAVTFICALLLSGCSGPQKSGKRAGAGEEEVSDIGCLQELGSDAVAQVAGATEIPKGKTTGCLGPSQTDGGDTFRFELPEDVVRDSLVRIAIEVGDGLTLCAAMHDTFRTEIARTCAKGAGQPLSMWSTAAAGKSLYLQLSPMLALTSTEPYSVDISFKPIEDQDEPNDYLDEATALEWGKPHSAFLIASAGSAPAEVDIYKVEMTKAGKLAIAVTDIPAEVSLAVELLDSQKTRLQRLGSGQRGGELQGEMKLADPGFYYLRVSNALGDFIPAAGGFGEPPSYTQKPYTITVSKP